MKDTDKVMGLSEKTIETLMQIGVTVLIILVGLILIKVTCKIVKKTLKKSGVDEVLFPFIVNCIKVTLWLIVAITAMSYLNIPVSAFLAALGAAGVTVALALKDSLSNFAGGLLILLTKPFGKGDLIESGGTSGKVEKIDLLYTTMVTFDNKVITIPNGLLSNSVMINYSRAEKRRVDCSFSVEFKQDIAQVKEILLAIVASNPEILPEPAPIIGVSGQGKRGVNLDLKVWCSNDDYYQVKYALEEQVKIAFDEAGITIPYEHVDVRTKS